MALIRLVNFMLLVILITSCSNEQRTYYNNGKLKAIYTLDSDGKKQGEENIYYPSGEVMTTSFYKDGITVDSIITFNEDSTLQSVLIIKDSSENYLKNYQNNSLVSSGKIDAKKRPTGWWKFYLKGKIVAEEERIIILNKSVVNRVKNYKGTSTDSLTSKLFDVNFPLEIIAGKQYPVKVKFSFDKMKSKNLLDKEYYYLLTSPDINENFSNLSKIKLDTIHLTKRNEFLIMLGFRSSGKRNFRGIIERHGMIRENEKLLVVKSQMFINEEISIF